MTRPSRRWRIGLAAAAIGTGVVLVTAVPAFALAGAAASLNPAGAVVSSPAGDHRHIVYSASAVLDDPAGADGAVEVSAFRSVDCVTPPVLLETDSFAVTGAGTTFLNGDFDVPNDGYIEVSYLVSDGASGTIERTATIDEPVTAANSPVVVIDTDDPATSGTIEVTGSATVDNYGYAVYVDGVQVGPPHNVPHCANDSVSFAAVPPGSTLEVLSLADPDIVLASYTAPLVDAGPRDDPADPADPGTAELARTGFDAVPVVVAAGALLAAGLAAVTVGVVRRARSPR